MLPASTGMMAHTKDSTHQRRSIHEHDEDTNMMRVAPTRKRSSLCSRMFQPGEPDYLKEYKGGSGMFYAKMNTSNQRSFEERKYNVDTTASFQADGSTKRNEEEKDPCCWCHQHHDDNDDVVERQQTKNPLLSKALQELDQSLIEGDRQRMAQSWNSLGLVRLHTQRDPHEAIRCHRNALQLLVSSSSSTSTATDEDGPSCGASVRAVPPCIDASSSSSSSCSQQSLLELATTYNDLGLCYERLNDTKEAMTMYLEAQKILSTEKLLVESHPRIVALNRAIDRIQRIL